MPLQNRVDPFGNLHAVPHRGKWMGNRGLLHNDRKEIVRHSQLKRWIYCKLEFKGWHRQVMRPGHYTELFFLDEATALAAGHRPCMECQRERATEFKRIWNEVNEPVKSLVEMDDVLHRERIGKKISAKLSDLPDGAIVSDEEFIFLVQKGQVLKWSFTDYQKSGSTQNFLVVTPTSVVNVLAKGFHIDLPT